MERPSWPQLALTTTLKDVTAALNLRLSRWADLISRTQVSHYATTTAALTLNEDHDILMVDTTGGNRTITLPLALTVPGKTFDVKKMVAGNTLTLAAAGSDTIDGAATLAWTTQYQSYRVTSVLTAVGDFNWIVLQ